MRFVALDVLAGSRIFEKIVIPEDIEITLRSRKHVYPAMPVFQ